MTDIADEVMFVRAPAVLWREVSDAVVVLGPNARKPRLITGPAASVWGLVGQPIAFGAVVATLAELHLAAVDVVRYDVQPVFRALQRDGALEIVT